jgi:nucleoid-associated protein YgaU
MSKWAAMAGSNGAMIASAVAVAVAAVGAGLYLNNRSAQDQVVVVRPAEPTSQALATPPDPVTPAPAAIADVPDVHPSIDEVRVEADGLTIVAGRALPGSRVSVLLDGIENTAVTADDGGGFAAITTIMPRPTAQVLTIVQMLEGKSLASLEEIILAPTPVSVVQAVPEERAQSQSTASTEIASAAPAASAASGVAQAPVAAEEDTVAAAPSPVPAPTTQVGEDVAERSEAEVSKDVTAVSPPPVANAVDEAPQEDADTVSVAPAKIAQAPTAADPVPQTTETAQQITVLKSTAEGVEVLGSTPEATASIAIDTISYSDVGDVQLAGRAQSNTEAVRVYVDNRPVTELPVDDQGRWRGNLPDIDTGLYTLRVDEVDQAGDVTSRVETPFRREDPQVLAAADAPANPATQITVQTGTTLWAIARERYGEGRLFVQVFEANRDTIRDPNLIYPGQVFALPD